MSICIVVKHRLNPLPLPPHSVGLPSSFRCSFGSSKCTSRQREVLQRPIAVEHAPIWFDSTICSLPRLVKGFKAVQESARDHAESYRKQGTHKKYFVPLVFDVQTKVSRNAALHQHVSLSEQVSMPLLHMETNMYEGIKAERRRG